MWIMLTVFVMYAYPWERRVIGESIVVTESVLVVGERDINKV